MIVVSYKKISLNLSSFILFETLVCGQDRYYNPNSYKIERIVNGSVVLPNKYPWMAIMTNQMVGICGGSIITDRTILSAGIFKFCSSNFQTLFNVV